MPRPNAEIDAIVRLSESADFAVYLKLLDDRIATLMRGLQAVLIDQAGVARHNSLLGMIEGVRLASGLVAGKVAVLRSEGK